MGHRLKSTESVLHSRAGFTASLVQWPVSQLSVLYGIVLYLANSVSANSVSKSHGRSEPQLLFSAMLQSEETEDMRGRIHFVWLCLDILPYASGRVPNISSTNITVFQELVEHIAITQTFQEPPS
uniref:Uncharacterized protein n=1 Tax=Sphaerodactylus townsendi TaxID=933632 RepID=A0ACB8EKE2_9SAUR